MSAAMNLAVIALFAPLGALFLIALGGRLHRTLAAAISTASIVCSLVCTCMIFAGNPLGMPAETVTITWLSSDYLTLSFGLLLDSLSLGMMLVVCIVSTLVHIYSFGYMADEVAMARYYAWLSLFSWAMLFFVISPTLLQAFFGWELVGAASFLLIGFWYRKPEAAQAARKAFIMTKFADLGFLFSVLALLVAYGSLDFATLNTIGKSPAVNSSFITICALGVFMGAMGKSAQFPLHTWLPDAMEGPTPASALIHAATMVAAGIYLIARAYGFFNASPFAMNFMAATGIVTALMAAGIALVQNDVKKVMAYSTISQLGLMVCALGNGAYVPGSFHLFTHAFFKALLFLCAGSLIHHFGTNDMWEMAKKGGARSMKITGTTLVIGSLALAGVPPFAGFFSKDAIVAALTLADKPVYSNLVLVVGFLTAYYTFRMVFVVMKSGYAGADDHDAHGHDHGHGHGDHGHHGSDSPAIMTVPLIVLAVLTSTVGFLDTPWLHGVFARFLGVHGEEAWHIDVILKSVVMASAGILLAWGHFGKDGAPDRGFIEKVPWLEKLLIARYYLDDFYRAAIHAFLYPLSAFTNWIDRKVINDTGINGSGALVVLAGKGFSLMMNGAVQRYLGATTVMVTALVVWWIL